MNNVTEQPHPDWGPAPNPNGRWGTTGGCLLGCAVAFGLLLIAILCAGGGTYYWVSSQIAKYTAEEPVDLPVVRYSDAQLDQLESRIETFVESIDQGDPPEEDLVLTAEEINALIAKEEAFRGKVYVTIADGQISGDISIPTDPIPGGKNRYLNASATLDASFADGVLIVTLADAEVNGQRVPAELLSELSRANLAKELYQDKRLAESMRKFESVVIEDDKIVLKVRRDSSAATERQSPAPEPAERSR